MDVDTAVAVERLSDRIDALELSFRGELREVRGEVREVRGEVGDVRGEVGELRGEVGELRGEVGELRGEVGGLRSEVGGLRGEVREGLAENRRHTQVLFESVRDDIRVLADG